MRRALVVIGLLSAMGTGCGGGSGHHATSTPAPPATSTPTTTPTSPPSRSPNILFVIMDDVGIDQMEIFGYGGDTPPSTPNLADIADAGIRFRNTWAMPACTTSRAVIFDARFPLRTNVKGALGPNDLANSMVSPYEVTVPKLLAQQGYESALFGKFHLALQGHDPAGYTMPYDRGWNYFSGWLDQTGDPSSIDTTAGGVAPAGTWSCGFVGGSDVGGADSGACYMVDGTCAAVSANGPVPPGRSCRDAGGIFDPNQACQTPPPPYLDFSKLSAHYVNPLVINRPDGSFDKVEPTDPRARRFRATQAVDDAVAWINEQPAGHPWMATVSFASAHTPVMQPPVGAAPGSAASSNLDCANIVDQRVLTNLMIEGIDTEVGRLLVATGLAERSPEGRLVYHPERTDTMLIIVGDNGTLGNAVKLPFQVSRSKGTAYQTGVWVPLVVSGPLVQQPGRTVSQMVNIADLFALFGEIAGIEDVQAAVPRPIDAMPMLPYVTNPNQQSIRAWNYTEVGANLQVGGAINQPCVISGGCTQIPVSKSVCEDNGGVWWGVGADAPETEGIPASGYDFCCQVNEFVVAKGSEAYNILPLVSVGIRNDHYKIVENSYQAYISQDQPCVQTTDIEFYSINEDAPHPKLDYAGTNLPLDSLTAEEQSNYNALSDQLAAIRASVPDCPGDGNIDFVVDDKDLDDWSFYNTSTGLSSVYDINIDGYTNAEDQGLIESYLGTDCHIAQSAGHGAALPRP